MADAQTAQPDIPRRDFLYIATGAFGAVGTAAALWPFINQMNPAANVRALAKTEVDVSAIEEGMAIKTIWQSKPVFVKRLTAAEIAEAEKVDVATLRDKQTVAERMPVKRGWLVNLGVCTHLGCVPLGAGQGEPKGDYGGFFCPCHGSHYDPLGRIRRGPAPLNLEIPPYTFKSDTVIEIG
ncbi:MAG: ubiquinol-cytochrome c reductase iron-sulfur subunit [Sphingomonadaceae bacterium]|uniref:ubiquinol-cytochrome c reductase iron-sulfur subunit n=1 Tax=Thermaurantiacus sp. TaxID=2820283 RepID=UPI00298EE980|nr:ubiquinol-cytochrome c reductase iron-sulfur subunit [Thermaurantiacus sp.]MCS6986800.1 ubiquinol-cytochrome c reductase iron-sulfur subunit [Sphingomonadaceae bacterium]MDW8413937.1 ubiquinol-cytochrome c reductase iron-sulfur subunit [Thermaurantiacus sp.]